MKNIILLAIVGSLLSLSQEANAQSEAWWHPGCNPPPSPLNYPTVEYFRSDNYPAVAEEVFFATEFPWAPSATDATINTRMRNSIVDIWPPGGSPGQDGTNHFDMGYFPFVLTPDAVAGEQSYHGDPNEIIESDILINKDFYDGKGGSFGDVGLDYSLTDTDGTLPVTRGRVIHLQSSLTQMRLGMDLG